MARPNFYLKTVIARELVGVTLQQHTIVPASPVGARDRWISSGWMHTANVRVDDCGMFTMYWHSDHKEQTSAPQWYLAMKVWDYRQRMKQITGKRKAA